MAAKELIKGLANTLVGPALWIALLLAMSSRAQGGVVREEFDVEPAGRLVIDFPVGGVRVETVPVRSGGGRIVVDRDAITNEGDPLRLRTLGGNIRIHEL